LLSAYALAKETVRRLRLGLKGRRTLAAPPWSIGPHLRNVLRDPGRLSAFAVRWARDRWLASRKVPSFLTDSPSGAYRFLFSAEQSPNKASTMALIDEMDAWGVPRLAVRWRLSSQDEESILRTLSIISAEVHDLRVGKATVPSGVDELRAEIGGGFLGGTHAMGTARMGATPRSGVVDADCRVHGISNLHVASSAIFPTSGFAAPTLTIVALAVRLARRLSASFGAP
jgi:choline dehydrogenase-like flavoprotein